MPVRNYRPLSQRYPSDVLWISKVWSISILDSCSQSSKTNGSNRLRYALVCWNTPDCLTVNHPIKRAMASIANFWNSKHLNHLTIVLLVAQFVKKKRGHHPSHDFCQAFCSHENSTSQPVFSHETVNQRLQDQRWSGTSATARVMCMTPRLEGDGVAWVKWNPVDMYNIFYHIYIYICMYVFIYIYNPVSLLHISVFKQKRSETRIPAEQTILTSRSSFNKGASQRAIGRLTVSSYLSPSYVGVRFQV